MITDDIEYVLSQFTENGGCHDDEDAHKIRLIIERIRAEKKLVLEEAAEVRAAHKKELERRLSHYREQESALTRLLDVATGHAREWIRKSNSGTRNMRAAGLRNLSVRKHWYARVIDPTVAVAHFASDPRVLRAVEIVASEAARSGVREIPGCAVEHKEVVT